MGQDLHKAYIEAIECAKAHGYLDDSYDFASWFVIRILEKKSKDQPIYFALIDYLRQKNKKQHTRRVLFQLSRPATRILNPLDALELKDTLEQLKDTEQAFLSLYYVDGLTLREIAEVFNYTESAACYELKRILGTISFIRDYGYNTCA